MHTFILYPMTTITWEAKVNLGTEWAHETGYGGSFFKFIEEGDEVRKSKKKVPSVFTLANYMGLLSFYTRLR